MKMCIITASLLCVVSAIAQADEYQDAYSEGYQDAKCGYTKMCVPPVAPVAPVPAVGEDDERSAYRAGEDQAEEEGLDSVYGN
jgi:hypothetical protein